MTDTPLNPDAILEAAVASRHALWDEDFWGFSSESDAQDYGFQEGAKWAQKQLALAQPELADAWEEGHKAGAEDTWNRPYGKPTPNPYKETE